MLFFITLSRDHSVDVDNADLGFSRAALLNLPLRTEMFSFTLNYKSIKMMKRVHYVKKLLVR